MLRRREAEAGDVRKRPDRTAVDLRAEREAGILDQRQAFLLRERGKLDQGCRMTEHVDRQEGARARCDRGPRLRRIHAERQRIDIDEDARGTRQMDGGDRADVGVGHRDHFVAGADAQRAQRELERRRARIDCHRMRCADEGSEFGLEGGHMIAPVEPAARQHTEDRRIDLRLAALVDAGVVVEGDGHHGAGRGR